MAALWHARLQRAQTPSVPPLRLDADQGQWVISLDTLVCDRHFVADVAPADLGYKALAVNLSDLAAMGARPRAALAMLSLDARRNEAWLAAFIEGFLGLAGAHGMQVQAGPLQTGPLSVSVEVVGEVAHGGSVTRAGARAEDDIWVSGTLGDAALALAMGEQLAQLPDEASAFLHTRLQRPDPRLSLGASLSGLAHAMIDISDGLAADLGHIAHRSGLRACLELERIPRSEPFAGYCPPHQVWSLLLGGGDDYELCFTADAAMRTQIECRAGEVDVAVTRVGRMTRGHGLVVNTAAGPQSVNALGFDHFRVSDPAG